MSSSLKKLLNLIRDNNFLGAESLAIKLIKKDQENKDYLFFYGLILAQKKNFEKSIACFERTITDQKYRYDSIFNIGGCYQSLGNFNKSIENYEICTKEFPMRFEPYQRLGMCYRALNDYVKSIKNLRKSLKIKEDFQTYFQLGNVYRENGNFIEARSSFNKSLDINNEFIESKIAMANLFLDEGHHQKAYENLKIIIDDQKLPPKYKSELKIDIGNVYKSQGKYKEAIKIYSEALLDMPKHPSATYNMAICYLFMKNFNLGWLYHEARLNLSIFGKLRGRLNKMTKPLWDLSKPKKNLLIWGEQGIGDIILYSQYLNIIKKLFINLSIAIDKKLIPFFQNIYPELNIIDINKINEFHDYDYHLPMGSLGLNFHNLFNRELLHNRIFYADKNSKLPKKIKSIRCGISWSSANKIFGHKKTVNLKLFEKIFLLSEIEFVNLQFQYDDNEIVNTEKQINKKLFNEHSIDCYNDIHSTASLISSCDFIITVSNTNAHIAGKLGVKSYLLLPYADGKLWYWGENEDDEILWYPSITPLRQVQDGDWNSCIKVLLKEMQKYL